MTLVFADQAWDDFTYYWMSHDRKMAARIVRLIEDTKRHPFEGLGKPEPLKHALRGFWFRRIDGEHRLVYAVEGDNLPARGTGVGARPRPGPGRPS